MASEMCAHPACDCDAPSGKEFCSDHCRSRGRNDKGTCDCGHEECES